MAAHVEQGLCLTQPFKSHAGSGMALPNLVVSGKGWMTQVATQPKPSSWRCLVKLSLTGGHRAHFIKTFKVHSKKYLKINKKTKKMNKYYYMMFLKY